MSGGKCVKDKGRYRLLRAALAVVTIACLIPVGRSCCLSIRHERQQRQLQKLKMESGANKPLANTEQKQGGQGNTGLQSLSEENHDLVGWLTIGVFSSITFPMLSQKSPIPTPHSPTHPLPLFGTGIPLYWGI